jgi:hypothetical protein
VAQPARLNPHTQSPHLLLQHQPSPYLAALSMRALL